MTNDTKCKNKVCYCSGACKQPYDFKLYDAMKEAMKQSEEEMKRLEKYLETGTDAKRTNRKD